MVKNISKGLGQLVDGAISGVGELASKGVKKAGFDEAAYFIEDTTSMIGKASGGSIAMTGQAVEGIYKTAKGQIQKDDFERSEGVDELKDAGGRVVRSVGSFLKNGVTNVYETGAGLATKDYDRAKKGAVNVAKLGLVSAFAFTIVDLVEGTDEVQAREIQSINAALVGDVHPVTGVPFELNEVHYDGQVITDAFPVFESSFKMQLPESMYLMTDDAQFRFANAQLADAIAAQPSLAAEIGLTEGQVADLYLNETPNGFVWHHHEQPGTLQLVDEKVHDQTAHTGGRFIWGGGSVYR
ncbi:HNH endonuclease [Solibacillus sp. FSL H8-0538]|uniref:HNH endonuclease n=1 Tax=Solibacillus sp. FSL H8-0538 TaxID=2921400 RepID=UPI0030F61BF5